MSSVRQKMTAVNKAALKLEEEKNNGNQPIIHANANIDIDKIAKKVDKEADEVLAKATKEVKSKVKKPKAISKVKAKVVNKK
jgi:phosphoribosyl-ATP pyrophosphohydrolase